MAKLDGRVNITFRIPGNWERPGKLQEQLPAGFRITPEHLTMPDGSKVDFYPMKADGQFANIFANSCRRPPTKSESQAVDDYTMNACLTGPGGSLESAQRMMLAAAAIVRAGGAGVFIDNSGLAHGGSLWLEMSDHASADALSFAYVGMVGGPQDIYTTGMHLLGRPDVAIRRSNQLDPSDKDQEAIIEIIRFLCATDREFEVGHIIANELGPRFKATGFEELKFDPSSPMYNPWGRLRLVSIKEIAENN